MSANLSQPIEIHFSLGTGISSALISWYGYGYGGYSHTDAILTSGDLAGARSDAVGGQRPGFRVRPPYYEPWKRSAKVSIPATPAEHYAWEQWLLAQVGDGYDGRDILGLIIGVPLNEGNGHWICSAAQRRGLSEPVTKLPKKLPFIDQQITPNTLLAMCAAIGGIVTEYGPTSKRDQ